MSRLLESVRQSWFNNEPGIFEIGGGPLTIKKRDIFRFGGPAPDLSGCDVCQWDEWQARLLQFPIYESPHRCDLAKTAIKRCAKQGDGCWTNYHQDHFFAVVEGGRHPKLNAPHGALLLQDCASQYEWFHKRNCSAGLATFRQKLAYVGTCDPEARIANKNWDEYDWAWLVNKGEIELQRRPPVPLVLYCHDAWRGNKQAVIDHYKPEVILTPFPTLWRENFTWPDECELRFTPALQSPFFCSPNLDDSRKVWDLLVIGSLSSEFYVPRRELNTQLETLPGRFRVEHSHETGSKRARWMGPLDDDRHAYMNRWMDKLGRARYVIFGPCAERAAVMLLIKYYECLASGAVPIMPAVKDLDLLGLESLVHFVPFSMVQDNNAFVEHLLDHYEDYRYIAENAVAWWSENVHDLVFGTFERLVRGLTGKRYPARQL